MQTYATSRIEEARKLAQEFAERVGGWVQEAGRDARRVKRGDLVFQVHVGHNGQATTVQAWPHFADQVQDLKEWRQPEAWTEIPYTFIIDGASFTEAATAKYWSAPDRLAHHATPRAAGSALRPFVWM